MVGGVVSITVMVWVALAVLPQPSVAVQTRVTILVLPQPSTGRSIEVKVTDPQLSVAVGVLKTG
jgi:hypothetical protein